MENWLGTRACGKGVIESFSRTQPGKEYGLSIACSRSAARWFTNYLSKSSPSNRWNKRHSKESDGDVLDGELLFDLGDGEGAEVEDTGGEDGVGFVSHP
jgi:hypothetical protein